MHEVSKIVESTLLCRIMRRYDDSRVRLVLVLINIGIADKLIRWENRGISKMVIIDYGYTYPITLYCSHVIRFWFI